MLPKKRILLATLLVLLAGVLVVCFSPIAIAGGIRLWTKWKGHQQKLAVEIDKISAPFLRPVVLQGVRVTSMPDAAVRIDLRISRATLELNLRTVLLRMSGRAIRSFSAETLHAEIHPTQSGTSISERGWNTLQNLLPTNLDLQQLELRVEDGPTVVLLHNASVTAREIEAGRFSAGEMMITSPWLHQSFSNLHGATSWQGDRLTIAGLSLTRGLDVQSVTVDLSRLGKQHLGLEFDTDVFGGKIRASISNEWHSHHANWNLAGSASDISLAQTSEAIGFADHVSGLLHAGKFTFRGNPSDPTQATASLWAELTGLKWRNRAAETIMLGAVVYNRQLQLQQLYLKQSKNQLTLSGEGTFPTKPSGWINPDFRGDISASIGDLGDFVGLFGANPGDFAGEIAIEGTMNARDRNIGGHLNATGKSLSIFKSPIESFKTKLNLKATELEIEQVELQRGNDFARATGKIDIAHEHEYSGTCTFTTANVADYTYLFPAAWRPVFQQGMVSGEWSGNGKANAHAGTIKVNGRGIRSSVPTDLAPFDAEVEAAYSPGNIFFRQLHLTNEHASLNGFLTVAPKYLQIQALALDLNGKPQLRGNIFLPVATSKLGQTSFIDALDPDQKVDIDLNVEPTDLVELTRALTGRVTMSGSFGARFSIFGGLDALQGWGDVHVRDLAMANDPAPVSAEAQTRFVAGALNAKANIQVRGSDPVLWDGTTQIRLGKERNNGLLGTMSATIDFPKVLLARLPRFIAHDSFRDGTLSGKLSMSETLRQPKLSGSVNLIKVKSDKTPLRSVETTAHVTLKGASASIDSALLRADHVDLSVHGDLDFADTNSISVRLLGNQPVADLTPREIGDCINSVKILPATASAPIVTRVDEMMLHWSATAGWNVSLNQAQTNSPPASPNTSNSGRTFRLCPKSDLDEKSLVLGCEPTKPVETPRPRKRSRHR